MKLPSIGEVILIMAGWVTFIGVLYLGISGNFGLFLDWTVADVISIGLVLGVIAVILTIVTENRKKTK